jgi:signal recognition particle receptor subunit beta
MTDAHGSGKLLSTQTTDDRTLFFDLLTVDLPDVLGYNIAIKLFTVPGQVRFDTARQVVLAGADAIIFVADSSVGREEQNRWSIQNLQMNMRAKRIDAARVPVLYQFNKQDRPDAAEPLEVAKWVRAPGEEGIAAVASEGRGVLESFGTACRMMLERLCAQPEGLFPADVDAAEIRPALKRAFAPFAARREWLLRTGELSEETASASREAIAAKGEDLLQDAIRAGVMLGERYTSESERRWHSARETDAYRKLVAFDYGARAGFGREAIVDAHLGAVADALEAAVVSLLRQSDGGQPLQDRIWGRADDPLHSSSWGRRVLRKMCATSKTSTIEDLSLACEDEEAKRHLAGLRSIAAVPVGDEGTGLLLVYAAQPDGRFSRKDLRYLAAVSVHLDAALQRAGSHAGIERDLERQERELDSWSDLLRRLRACAASLESRWNDLHGILTPESDAMLAEALDAVRLLRDKKVQGGKRSEALELIIDAVEQTRDGQRQVAERGERLGEELDVLMCLVAQCDVEQERAESGQERESECEVLNVG